jgi:putative DNA primase/helicase
VTSTDFEQRLEKLYAELAEATVTERRYMTQDPTTEKLGELCQENPRGLLVLRDELAGWLRTLERPGREGDREFYLEGWNGTQGYTFDRIGRGTVHIKALTLSILGGIQPGKLERYLQEALEGGAGADGLLQRFQLVVWPDHPGEWVNVDRYPNTEAKNRAYEVFAALDGLEPGVLGLTPSEDGSPALRFTPDAQDLFDTWRDELERRLRSSELDHKPAFESHLSKYRSLMPSLALLFHLVDVVDGKAEGAVSLEAAQLAAAWCDFLEAHALKLYAPEISAHIKAARDLAAKIDEGEVKDGATVRDIYRAGWEGLSDRNVVMAGLEVLAENNWLRVEDKSTGGRPTLVIRLHPELREGKQ